MIELFSKMLNLLGEIRNRCSIKRFFKFSRLKPGCFLNLETTRNKYMLVLGSLIILVGLQFSLGFGILLNTQLNIINQVKSDNERLDNYAQLKEGLAELQLFCTEKRFGIESNVTSDRLFIKITFSLKNLGNLSVNPNLSPLKRRITTLSHYLIQPVTSDNYPLIRAEINRSFANVNVLESAVRNSKQKTIAKIISWSSVLSLLFLLLFTLGILSSLYFTVKVSLKHQAALQNYKNWAKQFVQGTPKVGLPDCQSRELQELNQVLQDFLNKVYLHYQPLQAKVLELETTFRALYLSVSGYDDTYNEIRNQLEELIGSTYKKLDAYPEIAAHIKNLNLTLDHSQHEATVLQTSLQENSQKFRSISEPVDAITMKVGTRVSFSQQIINQLYGLRKILESLQQTVSVFQSISEQSTLLALNASIEAARAGAAGEGFSLAASEIGELSGKISHVSKDLLILVNSVGKKTEVVIRTQEIDQFKGKEIEHCLETIKDKLNTFGTTIDPLHEEIGQHGTQIKSFIAVERSLGELTSLLAELNQQSPTNHGKAISALEVIRKTEDLSQSVNRLGEMLDELNLAIERAV